MERKTPIMIALVALFLIINGALLYTFRGRFTGNPPVPPELRFADVSQRGSEAFQRRDYKQAAAAWDEAIKLEPNDSEIHRWRGDASMNLREFDKALAEYDEAIRLNPKNAMAYLCRAAIWTEKGDTDKALAAFETAVQLDPGLAGNSFYKRYRAAAELLRQSAQNPKFAEAIKRGSDSFQKGDYKQAAAAWDEALKHDPHDSETHRWRGDASMNQGEFDKALSEYEEAIRLDPKNAMAYLCRGMVWTEKREPDKALPAFDTAIQLDPDLAGNAVYKRYRTAVESLRNSSPASVKK